ncbi:trypsin-like serine protease [Pseudomonas sp. R2.Fl]|nr:trypsin-like serine protease [Pseudomonas sp. R2.Fl]
MKRIETRRRLRIATLLASVFAVMPVVLAADLKIENLKNDKAESFTSDEIEAAEPLSEEVTPEELEEMKQRFRELYPDAITVPPRKGGEVQQKGQPEPVDHPGANSPYWNTGKLVFRKSGGGTHRCTAQFVDTNVLLTAAHCVYDAAAKAWNSEFRFYQAYDDGDYTQSVGWRCVSIFSAYHTPAKNYAFDYAFILTDTADDQAPLAMHTGAPATVPLTAVGYPRNYGDGKRLYSVDGDWGTVDGGIVTMTGNPMRSGNSGGAWFSEFKVDGGDTNNLVVSLNSHHVSGNDTDENGPLFTADTEILLGHVRGGGCL